MTSSRAETMWGLVATHAAVRGRPVSVTDVCAVAAERAEVTGAWLTASGQGAEFVIAVTDPLGEQLAELQLTLGEGPCHDVLTSVGPILADDLGDGESASRWPAFTEAASRLGTCAVFAFPLTIGTIRAGTIGLHRHRPGPMTRDQVGDVLLLADTATVLMLSAAASSDSDGPALDGQAPDLALRRAEIDQATGMLTIQLGLTAAEAFIRLRAYAYAHDRRLADVAGDVVARRLRLRPDPDPDPASEGPR